MSSTIDMYVRLVIADVAVPHLKLMYSEIEQVSDVSELRHNLVKAVLERYGPRENIEIASFADVPTSGSGLGSSSTFLVGLLNAVHAWHGINLPRAALADIACDIEINECGAKIGKQDQYAAAFGGFNMINFSKGGGVKVQPINANWETIRELNDNLYLIPVPKARSASEVLTPTVQALEESDPQVISAITNLVHKASEAHAMLEAEQLDQIGHLLDETWNSKKIMTPGAVTPEIDELYRQLKQLSGVIGGKILGAGGGGFLLVYVPRRNDTLFWGSAFTDKFEPRRFTFTDEGTRVVYRD